MSARWPVFAVVFAIVYTLAYLIAVQRNVALFTYHPQLNEFGIGVEQPKDGPAMYWYGWMASAGIAAAAAGLLASLLPARVTRYFWSGLAWAVPLCAMLAFAFLLRGFFLR